jgi:hypothetical protein
MSYNLIKALLENGADPIAKDKRERTKLDIILKTKRWYYDTHYNNNFRTRSIELLKKYEIVAKIKHRLVMEKIRSFVRNYWCTHPDSYYVRKMLSKWDTSIEV